MFEYLNTLFVLLNDLTTHLWLYIIILIIINQASWSIHLLHLGIFRSRRCIAEHELLLELLQELRTSLDINKE